MNCQLCQKESDAYLEGRLPEGIRAQVDAHLAQCVTCAESYRLLRLSEKVMEAEKTVLSNPFLSTRVMAGIEKLEREKESYQNIPAYWKVLKPALIGLSIGVAIFLGILAGDLYKPANPANAVPVEMSYMDDAALESVSMFDAN